MIYQILNILSESQKDRGGIAFFPHRALGSRMVMTDSCHLKLSWGYF
ncbi:hypothetical protein pah_c010o004 [Parachlamydia acanthamoebae str. Hall's coccus]|nr:hypothetical protein pah_c010o004 [Parachlamydia acanthamoebae str. Hall's coccus]